MKLSNLLLGVSLTFGSGFGADLIIEEYKNAEASFDFFDNKLRDKIEGFQTTVGGDIFKEALLNSSDSPEVVYTKTQLLENASRFIIDMERLVTMHTLIQQCVEVLKTVLETFTDGSRSRTPTEGRSNDEECETANGADSDTK